MKWWETFQVWAENVLVLVFLFRIVRMEPYPCRKCKFFHTILAFDVFFLLHGHFLIISWRPIIIIWCCFSGRIMRLWILLPRHNDLSIAVWNGLGNCIGSWNRNLRLGYVMHLLNLPWIERAAWHRLILHQLWLNIGFILISNCLHCRINLLLGLRLLLNHIRAFAFLKCEQAIVCVWVCLDPSIPAIQYSGLHVGSQAVTGLMLSLALAWLNSQLPWLDWLIHAKWCLYLFLLAIGIVSKGHLINNTWWNSWIMWLVILLIIGVHFVDWNIA